MPIYRTSGAWGVGKGANLTAGEVDQNVYEHETRIEDLETSRPQPDNIASVTVEGTQISFTLVSGAVLGPVDLPVLSWRYRGDWQPLTGYAALDTFQVAGDGLYVVLLDHTSDSSFDPDAAMVGETVAAGSFIAGVAYTILTVGTTDFTTIGASVNTVGTSFTATGAGSGSGTATVNLSLYSLLLGLGLAPAVPMPMFLPGQMQGGADADRTRARILLPGGADFPINFSGSEARARVAADAETVFAINGVSSIGAVTAIGTLTIAAGDTAGAFASTDGLAQSLASSSMLEVLAPATADATLADLAITFMAIRS